MGLRSEQSSGIWEKLRSPSFPTYRSTKAVLNMLTLHYAALFEEQGGRLMPRLRIRLPRISRAGLDDLCLNLLLIL